MNQATFTKAKGYCRIKSFDLNTRENGKLGIPELNPADSYLITLFSEDGDIHILIDAGKKGQGEQIIIPYLIEQNIVHLDYLILSHMHYDHFGGMIDLLNEPKISVGQLIYAPLPLASVEKGDVGELNFSLWREFLACLDQGQLDSRVINQEQVGSSILIQPSLSLEIIAVPNLEKAAKEERVNLNNYNLVLKLNYKNFTALFPGDCGVQQTEAIKASPQKENLQNLSLLKASHHGGDESMTKEMIEWCNPQIVLIPCNHLVVEARPSFIQNLHDFSKNGARIFRSDWYNEIEVLTDGTSVKCLAATGSYAEEVWFPRI